MYSPSIQCFGNGDDKTSPAGCCLPAHTPTFSLNGVEFFWQNLFQGVNWPTWQRDSQPSPNSSPQSDNNIDSNKNAQLYSDSSSPALDPKFNQIASTSSAGDGTGPGVTETTSPLPITPNDGASPAAPFTPNLGLFSEPGSAVAANPIPDYSTSLDDPLTQNS